MGSVAPASVELPDGARLHTELHAEQPDHRPSVTVVLLHGWTLDKRLWRRQVADLAALVDAPIRVLTFDLRGHGRSTTSTRSAATLAQLADDLDVVLRERAPEGRLVLVGHSLGGMTIMEYAHRHPDDFARRVAGVAFVSTSAEGSSRTSYGVGPRLAWVMRVLETQSAALLARSGHWRPHRLLMPLLSPGVRWLVFGHRVDSSWVALTTKMVGSAPLSAIGSFRPAVGLHHRVDALVAMRNLPVTVLVGSVDRLTPRQCAETIVQALPHAEHLIFDGAGHMLPIERADEVTAAIARLVNAVVAQPKKRRKVRDTLRGLRRAVTGPPKPDHAAA